MYLIVKIFRKLNMTEYDIKDFVKKMMDVKTDKLIQITGEFEYYLKNDSFNIELYVSDKERYIILSRLIKLIERNEDAYSILELIIENHS